MSQEGDGGKGTLVTKSYLTALGNIILIVLLAEYQYEQVVLS